MIARVGSSLMIIVTVFISDFREHKLNTAMLKLKKNTAPGPDKIHNQMIRDQRMQKGIYWTYMINCSSLDIFQSAEGSRS